MFILLHNQQIGSRDDKKLQTILDYNFTKGAIDTLTQFIATYS